MRRILVMVTALSLALAAFGQQASKKKKHKIEMPAVVAAAQFVYVTSFHGNELDPNTTSEDRAAIDKIQTALRAWGKYHVVYQPENADIMLIVKPAGIAQARVGIDVGNPPVGVGPSGGRMQTGPGVGIGLGPTVGAEVSNTPDDMLAVSLHPQEPAAMAALIWRRSAHDGLQGSKPALFEEFRKEVDDVQQQTGKNP